MRSTIFAFLLMVASSLAIATSYGQGQFWFENYNFGITTLNAPVTFGTTANVGGINAVAGTKVGKEFTADVLYSFDGGANYSLLSAAQSQDSTYPTPFAFGVGSDGDVANSAGYFFGNIATIPGYASGPVTFIVEAYNGASFNGANTTWRGRSAPFTMPALSTGLTLPYDFAGLTGFTVDSVPQLSSYSVPEPSLIALAGAGGALLMLVRRRK
jgi:hypothetical protein